MVKPAGPIGMVNSLADSGSDGAHEGFAVHLRRCS